MATDTQAARDRLVNDFKKVINDTEALLEATANQTGDKIGAVRERAEETLREARRKLLAMENDLIVQTKAAVKATDELVHENPWQAVALAATVGLLLGLLSGRR
ncbi:MAG: DUF883 family protein [Gammaproteobacteria bacterium]